MQKKQILIDGKILSYYENSLWIKEWVLVFLHGWMQNWKSFEKIFSILEEKNIPYISLDLPGFWWSALMHENMSIEEYGDAVVSVIEKLWLTNPILVWHSFGGRISIYLWSYYKNISKIVLIGSAGITTPINPLRLAIVKTGKLILSLPWLGGLKNKAKSAISSGDYKSAGKLEQIFRNAISNDLRKYMKDIPYPVLMIWGNEDDQTLVSEWTIIHDYIQNSEFHILEGTHFIHQEKAEKVSDLILDFIK